MKFKYEIRLTGALADLDKMAAKLADRIQVTGWVEVSKDEYMHAERLAGFISQHVGEPATHSFSGGNIQGRTTLVTEGTE